MVEDDTFSNQLLTRDGLGPFAELFSWDVHLFNVLTQDKDALLSEMCASLKGHISDADRELYFQHLLKRELLCSTGMGDGIAIPHPRSPLHSLFPEPKIIFAYHNAGVEYNAPDRKVVHFFFMICANRDDIHLRILTKLSRLLRAGLTTRLQGITTMRELQQSITNLEMEIQ